MALQCKGLQIYDGPSSVVMEIWISGKLTREDYENFESEFERVLLTQERVRFKIMLHEFNGWKENALWKHVKFNSKHFTEVDRICIVGKARWAGAMTLFHKPFTQAMVRYFDFAAAQEADRWIAATQES